MTTFRLARDRNGNRTLRVSIPGARGFSIQTNGNLIRTHRDGVGPWTSSEVHQWVKEHGTARQKALLGW